MVGIERYSEIAKGSDASISMDQSGQNLLTKAPQRSLLGRIAYRLNSLRSSVKAQNRAAWQDFAETIKNHYKNDAAIDPVLRDLLKHSAHKKPLTTMQVRTSLKHAEQLMRFKNEQIIASVLNAPAEPGAEHPPGLADTASDFLRHAMDDVYHDVAGRTNRADADAYQQLSAQLAQHIIAQVNELKPEAGEPSLTRSQVEQAIKAAARDRVSFHVVTQEQSVTTNHYQLDKNLPADAPGNRIFLELAKKHGLSIDLKKLPPTVIAEFKTDISKASADVYQELRTNQGQGRAVTEADVEAAIAARLSRSLKNNYLSTVEQIRGLDLDAASEAKLIDYVCHTSRAVAAHFDLISNVLEQKPQLLAFYQSLPQRLQAVNESGDDAVSNQTAKTQLYTDMLEHGKMLGAQWGEFAAVYEAAGKEIGPDDRESFYSAAAELPAVLFLNDEEAEQLHQACAMPAMQEAVATMRSLDYVTSSAGAHALAMSYSDDEEIQAQQMRQEFGRASHAAFVAFYTNLEASPYSEASADSQLASAEMADSFSELDNSAIGALHASGCTLPFFDRSNQSGAAAIPPGLHAEMQNNLNSDFKFGSTELDYVDQGIAKSFITTFGRANFTLTTVDGQTVDLPRELPGDFKERSQVMLPKFRSFCYQHQQDAWMKKHQQAGNEQELQKLADNELKLIAQLANANLWADFNSCIAHGKLPYHGAISGTQLVHNHYHIVAEADGGFRCESATTQKGGFLTATADADPTDMNTLLVLDPEAAHIKAELCVHARPEDFADGSDSSSVPQLDPRIGYEYNLKLAATD